MNLGGDRYAKIQVRSAQAKRWAKLRRENTQVPTAPPGRGAEMVSEYLRPDEERIDTLKRAGIFALLFHFLVLMLVIPLAGPDAIPIERTAAITVKRYSPPSPPKQVQKKTATKKRATVVPIPDPTPEDPEPIEPEEGAEFEAGEFDAEFAVGEPVGGPRGMGARQGALRAGEGGVASPVVLRQFDPEYTPEATRKGIQGEVWIEAVVDIEGKVVEPRLLRGLPDEELNRRAMAAIQQWVFRPGMKDGQPVPVIAVFTVTYRLH